MARTTRTAVAAMAILAAVFSGAMAVLWAPTTAAHPGGLDSDGCHTCRTNCADHGLGHGEYHCNHDGGGGTPAPAEPPASVEPTQAQINSIDRLYQAYFLRESDPGGLDYWATLHANGRSLSSISQHFSQSSEFQNTYGSLTDGEFVDLIYANVLQRDDDDPRDSGYDFWRSQLDRGVRSRGEVMIGFSESNEFRNITGIP